VQPPQIEAHVAASLIGLMMSLTVVELPFVWTQAEMETKMFQVGEPLWLSG
jgi:hypothetical protein